MYFTKFSTVFKCTFHLFAATASCPTLGCEYKCQASLTGGACSCPNGRMISADNRTCIDKNECNEWGFCDQICTNTEGSYVCSCANGYTLRDNSKCVAGNASEMLIYFAYDKNVYKMNPRGEEVKIVANTTGASGLDFHYEKNVLFWSDIKTRKVRNFPLVVLILFMDMKKRPNVYYLKIKIIYVLVQKCNLCCSKSTVSNSLQSSYRKYTKRASLFLPIIDLKIE